MKRIFLTMLMMVIGITIINAQTCNRCGNTGRITETCQVCHGSGSRGCNYCTDGYKMCTACMKEVSYECSACNGTGKDDDDETCSTCSGRGRITCQRCSGDGVVMCESCQGSSSSSCFNCGGSGKKEWRCPECIAAGRI